MSDLSRITPLSELREGQRGVVAKVRSERDVMGRLRELGLRIGGEVEVVRAASGGAMIIAAGDGRMALGKATAEKILVAPL